MFSLRSIWTGVTVSLMSLFLAPSVSAQSITGTINTYTQVTAVAGNVVTVASAAGIVAGDRILIIQMQDADVDLTNTASAGSIVCYNHSGKFDFGIVASVSGNNVTLVTTPCRTYNPARRVQLIRIPNHANPTVTGTLTCPAWNGTTGGVLVLQTPGTLTLNANIDVSGLGYRGGATSCNALNCTQANFWYATATCNSAEKGEGIGMQVAGTTAGRGRLANGGGGGNSVNAGGGGGGGQGIGGPGGNEWGGCGGTANGGQSGVNLVALNSGCERAFMGGGGGGGQSNASEGTGGGNGGGLVIIVANTIVGNGFTIRSVGNTAGNAAHGGAGGGGAGGSVLIYCPTYTGTLNVNVSGGKGGDNTGDGGNPVGPGGGGGGGLLWVSTAALPGNVVVTANGGATGNMTTGGTHSATAGAAGAALTGLPVPCASVCGAPCVILDANSDLSLTATRQSDPRRIALQWTTREEIGSSHFVVQRSDRPGDFEELTSYPAKGESPMAQDYTYLDQDASTGTAYYRVLLYGMDGEVQAHSTVQVLPAESAAGIPQIWPQPLVAGENLHVEMSLAQAAELPYAFYDLRGSLVLAGHVKHLGGHQNLSLPTATLTRGLYFLVLQGPEGAHRLKCVIE